MSNYQLSNSKDKMFTLHWNGKIIKALSHVGKNCEHFAVILTGTDGKNFFSQSLV